MTSYIKREDAERLVREQFIAEDGALPNQDGEELLERIAALPSALENAIEGRMHEPRPGVIEIAPADSEVGQRVLIVPVAEPKLPPRGHEQGGGTLL